MGHIKNLVDSKKSDIINFWDTILKFQVAAPCTFRAMFLKTYILNFLGSGIKEIQQSPILNNMHVSGKGHLHNKRYGHIIFWWSQKIGHYQFLGHHFEIPICSPLYLQGHVSQNVYPKILGKWHKNNTAEPNTQHHARFR